MSYPPIPFNSWFFDNSVGVFLFRVPATLDHPEGFMMAIQDLCACDKQWRALISKVARASWIDAVGGPIPQMLSLVPNWSTYCLQNADSWEKWGKV